MTKNINFDCDTRHDVSNKTLATLKKTMFSQDEFGMKKYNEPLHHNYKYDWMEMFLQEMADGMKYIQCEMDRKADIVTLLEAAMRVNNPKLYVEAALELLKIEGTGK